MFKDDKEKTRFYYMAKEIAEIIDIQIDEIKERDGHFDYDVTYISTDDKKGCICIDTEYINEDDGKRYNLHEEVNGYDGTFMYFAKLFYMWLSTFACAVEHGVEFSGNV